MQDMIIQYTTTSYNTIKYNAIHVDTMRYITTRYTARRDHSWKEKVNQAAAAAAQAWKSMEVSKYLKCPKKKKKAQG